MVPAAPGQSVLVQQLVHGTWTTIASPDLDGDTLSRFRWTAGQGSGDDVFRVVKPRDALNVAGFAGRSLWSSADPTRALGGTRRLVA